MTKHITLPAVATDILAGRSDATMIRDAIFVAYWMHDRDTDAALFHLRMAHEALANLADTFGYTITPKVSPDALRAEHSTICEAMNRGTWPGSEADALARIDAIKAEIAKLEQVK